MNRLWAPGPRLPRRSIGDACTGEILKALTDGPRASEQYASALAAFVAGVSGDLGPEVGARFGSAVVSALAEARAVGVGGASCCELVRPVRLKGVRFQIFKGSNYNCFQTCRLSAFQSTRRCSGTYRAEERARPAANLVAVLARLHTCGVYPSRVCYGLLTELSRGLSELDATLMLGLLRAAGSRLRSEDPAGMKDFIVALQSRVAELQQSDEGGAGGGAGGAGVGGGGAAAAAAATAAAAGGLTRRARLMLDMVIDLKNNKKVVGAGAGGAGGAEGGDQWGFPSALGKWLKSSAAVGDAAVALRALTYERWGVVVEAVNSFDP